MSRLRRAVRLFALPVVVALLVFTVLSLSGMSLPQGWPVLAVVVGLVPLVAVFRGRRGR